MLSKPLVSALFVSALPLFLVKILFLVKTVSASQGDVPSYVHAHASCGPVSIYSCDSCDPSKFDGLPSTEYLTEYGAMSFPPDKVVDEFLESEPMQLLQQKIEQRESWREHHSPETEAATRMAERYLGERLQSPEIWAALHMNAEKEYRIVAYENGPQGRGFGRGTPITQGIPHIDAFGAWIIRGSLTPAREELATQAMKKYDSNPESVIALNLWVLVEDRETCAPLGFRVKPKLSDVEQQSWRFDEPDLWKLREGILRKHGILDGESKIEYAIAREPKTTWIFRTLPQGAKAGWDKCPVHVSLGKEVAGRKQWGRRKSWEIRFLIVENTMLSHDGPLEEVGVVISHPAKKYPPPGLSDKKRESRGQSSLDAEAREFVPHRFLSAHAPEFVPAEFP